MYNKYSRLTEILRQNLPHASQGAHGAVAKATGREAPAQGSNPGCGT
jgi:hypothetical protein